MDVLTVNLAATSVYCSHWRIYARNRVLHTIAGFYIWIIAHKSSRTTRARLGAWCKSFWHRIVYSACCARSHRVALWLEIDFFADARRYSRPSYAFGAAGLYQWRRYRNYCGSCDRSSHIRMFQTLWLWFLCDSDECSEIHTGFSNLILFQLIQRSNI